jgi:hypothetical protein
MLVLYARSYTQTYRAYRDLRAGAERKGYSNPRAFALFYTVSWLFLTITGTVGIVETVVTRPDLRWLTPVGVVTVAVSVWSLWQVD